MRETREQLTVWRQIKRTSKSRIWSWLEQWIFWLILTCNVATFTLAFYKTLLGLLSTSFTIITVECLTREVTNLGLVWAAVEMRKHLSRRSPPDMCWQRGGRSVWREGGRRQLLNFRSSCDVSTLSTNTGSENAKLGLIKTKTSYQTVTISFYDSQDLSVIWKLTSPIYIL